MTVDPVTRTARRQTVVDRIAELLTDWGCPAVYAPDRAALILETVEQAGWHLAPWLDDAPLRGPGSTDQGRAKARRILENTRAGCTCGGDALALLPDMHRSTCPVRIAHRRGHQTAPESPQNGPGSPHTTRGVS